MDNATLRRALATQKPADFPVTSPLWTGPIMSCGRDGMKEIIRWPTKSELEYAHFLRVKALRMEIFGEPQMPYEDMHFSGER